MGETYCQKSQNRVFRTRIHPRPPRLELPVEDLETLVQNNPPPPPPLPKIRTSHGGLCVRDWCVETTAVSPEDTVSLWQFVPVNRSTFNICWLICGLHPFRFTDEKELLKYFVLRRRLIPLPMGISTFVKECHL